MHVRISLFADGYDLICYPDHNDKGLDQASEREDLEGKELKQEITLHELEPVAVHALRELISLVHSHVNPAEQRQPEQSTSTTDSAISVKDKGNKVMRSDAFRLEDDPVANIIWTLPPCTLQRVLLAMVVSLKSLTFVANLALINFNR